jgi:hypothetical protein
VAGEVGIRPNQVWERRHVILARARNLFCIQWEEITSVLELTDRFLGNIDLGIEIRQPKVYFQFKHDTLTNKRATDCALSSKRLT